MGLLILNHLAHSNIHRRALAALAKLKKGCAWTEDDLLDAYYKLVYDAHAKQYQAAAEILGVKWRKVKSRVHPALPNQVK